MKRTLSILAALLLLATVCSCQGNSTNNGDGGNEGNAGQTDSEYQYPDINMGGETITVLNSEQFASMKIDFVVAQDATDTLDVAIYESNMRMQEQFNFTLAEDDFAYTGWETMYIDMGNHFVKNATSGSDVYDFIHFPVNQRMELMTNGYIMDLSELDALQLDKPWWDTQLNEQINVNGRQYMVSGSINLMPYEAMTTVFFNKGILADNGLDSPYDMVRDGTWTFDALIELAQEAMTLNSDSNWWTFEGGTSVLGITLHRDFPAHFLVGAGINYVTEADGKYTFAMESDDFFDAVEKIATMFTGCSSGGIGGGDASTGPQHYLTLFSSGRSLFTMGELKAGVEMRDSEVNFGILPTPKLREDQENYYSDETERLHFVCIPTTSENPEDVSAILDAMAYDRYKNVVPVYYDSYITYKGTRDEDSLEMLEIMSAGRTMDIGVAYGWCSEFVTQINYNITKDTISSMIASETGNINETIDDFVADYLS